MNSTNIVYLSPKCHKLSEYGKDFTDAYVFVKQLQGNLTHPILLNFTANKNAHRLKLRMGDQRFNRLLKSAISRRLASYNGNNLILITHTAERKLFGINSANNYEPVKVEHVKQFIQIQILKHNIKSQQKAIKCKLRSTAKLGAANVTGINTQITLSSRSAAKLLNLKSYTHANNLLANLKGFGLSLTKNKQQISEQQYNYFRSIGNHNARFDKLSGQFFFLGASLPHFSSFYAKPVVKSTGHSYWNNDNW